MLYWYTNGNLTLVHKVYGFKLGQYSTPTFVIFKFLKKSLRCLHMIKNVSVFITGALQTKWVFILIN
jgi:hypothetical protein